MNNYLLDGEMYQYNLGWLIKRIKDMETSLNTAIDLKTIHYADPLHWDITTQYSPNTVVVDQKTGTAYMSKVPVPAGILLTNESYWVVVFNYQDIYEEIKDGIASNERSNEYASNDYAVNDLVWWSNNLYLVLKPITSGGQFKPDDNISKTKIEDYLPVYDGATETLSILGRLTSDGNSGISKVNFNGTDLDVKDTRAREQLTHLTADNYTADVANSYNVNAKNATTTITGDYTVNAGDISMSSENATMHTTGDREIDTDGNDSVHIDGASTLNVGGLRTETFAGDKTETVTGTATEKFSNINTTVTGKWMVNTPSRSFSMDDVALKTDVVNLPFLDMTQYGVSEDAEDNADAINSIITMYGDSYMLYLKKGTYKIKSPVLINRNDINMVCDGTIDAKSDCMHITSSGNNINLYSIVGSGTGVGVLMQSNTSAIGNSIVNIQFIDKFAIGLKLLSGTAGIQNNIFNILRIDHFTTAIEIACSDGEGWVNENKFYNTWCFGYTATETAVKFIKGSSQTDPFNGNRFVNFSGEGCKTLFNLSFACRNTFENFRLIEQSRSDTIVCSADSQDNIFSSDNSMLDYTCINDKGENNIYNVLFYDDGNKLCRQMITLQGLLMATNHAPYYMQSSYTFVSKNGSVPAHRLATWITLINKTTNEMTVVLPLTAGFPQIGASFTIETGDLTGLTKVVGYGGQLITTSADTSGITGIQLKPWTHYLFTVIDYSSYKVSVIASTS